MITDIVGTDDSKLSQSRI